VSGLNPPSSGSAADSSSSSSSSGFCFSCGSVAEQPKLPPPPIEMNPLDADRQIDQMIAFIKQEAKEKAEEIRIKTEKEFMADKLSYETQQNLIIRQEHEKMKKDLLIQKRIEKSKKLSEARFTVMRKRDEKINALKKEVLTRLSEVSKKPEYKTLVRFLIAQGLVTMQEPASFCSAEKRIYTLSRASSILV